MQTPSTFKLLQRLKELHPEYEFRLSDSASEKAWKQLLNYYKSAKTKCKSIEGNNFINVGSMVKYPNGLTEFNQFDKVKFNPTTLSEYIDETEFLKFCEIIVQEIKDQHSAKAAVATKAETILNGSDGETKETYAPLSVHLFISKYSNADKEMFKWFTKDDQGNLYLKTKKGYLPIHFTSEDGLVSEGAEFWSEFFKMYRPTLIKWVEYLRDICMKDILSQDIDLSKLRRDLDTNTEISTIDKLHIEIPKAILNQSFAKLTFNTFENEHGTLITNLINADLTLRLSSQAQAGVVCTEENWIEVFKKIIPRLDPSEIDLLKRYSVDNSIQAIWHFNTNLIEPKLKMPPTWHKFFDKKFKVDREAQLYRICKFLTLLLQEDNQNRQALVIAGKGREGKSLFCDIIVRSLNKIFNCSHSRVKFANDITTEAFEQGESARGNLESIIDSMLIYIPDVADTYKLLTSNKFKNITGSDPITADIKSKKPVKKQMLGTKCIVTTNSCTKMPDASTSSRVLPVWFNRDDEEPDFDMYEMGMAMQEEFVDFLSFSYAYCDYIEKKFEIQKSECYRTCPIFSSDNYSKPLKEVYESLGDSKKFFLYNTAADYDEVFEEMHSDMCQELHVESAPTERVNVKEFYQSLLRALDYLGYEHLKSRYSYPPSVERRKFKEYLTKTYNIKSIISNGVRYYQGIKYTPIVVEKKDSHAAQPWANTPDPEKDKIKADLELFNPADPNSKFPF